MTSRQPTTWEEYERGGTPHRSDSASSIGHQSVHFEEQALLGDREGEASGNDHEWAGRLRRRYAATIESVS